MTNPLGFPFPDVSIEAARAEQDRERRLLQADGVVLDEQPDDDSAVITAVEPPKAPHVGDRVLVDLGGGIRPAVVTSVTPSLCIYGVAFDHRMSHGTIPIASIPFGIGPGTWHWPR